MTESKTFTDYLDSTSTLQPDLEPTFTAWPKIPRLNRNMIVTEKIDGTNAAVGVMGNGFVYAQSRNRVIAPGEDGFGFASWVDANHEALREGLGVGIHFGEWWGSGIQRGYGLPRGEKRFSLFNTGRWSSLFNDADAPFGENTTCLECDVCHVVPVLTRYAFDTTEVARMLAMLKTFGSAAAPGFRRPEGVVVFHTAANSMFKATIKGDAPHEPK